MNARASAQIEIDYLREEIFRLKERASDIFYARELLKKHGYYSSNLWHIEDVTIPHAVSNEKAYEILHRVLRSEGVVSYIQDAIEIVVSEQ
jgi:hypothetical protein